MKLALRIAGIALAAFGLPACGVSGDGTLNPTVAPASPADVKALSGNQSVTLSWTASALGSSYSVWRAPSPGGPFVSISVPGQFATPTSYQDLGLSNGTPYYYLVKASNAFGESEPSGIASASPGFKATAIAAGGSFGMALLADQSIWAWGDNHLGQLANPSAISTNNPPLQIPTFQHVGAIAAGSSIGLALLGDGTVWEWGVRGEPVQVQDLTGVIAVAAGSIDPVKNLSNLAYSSLLGLALKSDGTVWSWTWSGSGVPVPGAVTQVQTPPGITAIAAGPNFGLALRNDGTVWGWGDNTTGQTGNGDSIPSSTSPPPVTTPAQVVNLTEVTAISAGRGFGLALRKDGSVWAWGDDTVGQLGDGSSSAPFIVTIPTQVLLPVGSVMTSISAGAYHGLALRSDGTVWAWGDNIEGELGAGLASTVPVRNPVQVQNLTQATAIGAGTRWSMAVFDGGSVCTWGQNDLGQLGTGQGEDYSNPRQVSNLTGATALSTGGAFSMGLRTGGSLYAWGDNTTGELGQGSHLAESPLPVQVVPSSTGFTAISAGPGFGLALLSNGNVFAWGNNSSGELGNGSTSTTPVTFMGAVGLPVGSVCTAVSAGGNFGLALRSDGSVWAWGDNTFGEVGNGTTSTTPVTTPVQVSFPVGSVVTAISAGPDFALALLSDGSVWAWGNNTGELCTQPASSVPLSTPAPVVFPTGTAATGICAGGGLYHIGLLQQMSRFGLALRSDGSVWAWGDNTDGELGSIAKATAPAPVPLPDGSVFTAMAAGAHFGVALRSDGTVWGWGENQFGQLGPDLSPNLTPSQVPGLSGVTTVAAGGDSLLVILTSQTVWGLGVNSSDQLGTPFFGFLPFPVIISH
ncbi:MAG TPA: RCC1 repeat-containing protein [Planctomycetota bacterium]|nr:RCC1 repeat-containing protein [Planctomycetota bacterium]